MNIIKKIGIILALCLFTLSSTACSELLSMLPSDHSDTINEENFRLLISDDANAIGDFASVNVTISKIGVHGSGSDEGWTEYVPDITEVDLKPLTGENALEIWNGSLTPGEYNKIFVYVESVAGILTEEMGGGLAEVTLPSNKLHISKPFTVRDDGTTSFVFDITVIKAGKSGKYNLQPQIAQSGAEKEYKEVNQQQGPKDKTDTQLENNIWLLASYGTPDNLIIVLEDTEITIKFRSTSGEFQGSSGCNTYFGSYEIDEDILTILPPAVQTEMACPEPIMEQEAAYLAILQAAERYEITGNQLQIICGDKLLNYLKK